MNKLIMISLALLMMGSTAPTEESIWLKNIDLAKAQAKEKNQNILIVFAGSDWCRPCMIQDLKVFETSAFQEYATANYVLLKADFPKRKANLLEPEQVKHNQDLAKLYNQTGSFPLNVIIDHEGKQLTKFGFIGNPDAYINKLKSIN